MQSETLFDQPRARHNDASTSKAAAARMAGAVPNLEAQIIDLLGQRSWGLTKDQVCVHLKVDTRRWPSVASCLSRLKINGTLEWTGEVVEGQNVWRLKVALVETRGRL